MYEILQPTVNSQSCIEMPSVCIYDGHYEAISTVTYLAKGDLCEDPGQLHFYLPSHALRLGKGGAQREVGSVRKNNFAIVPTSLVVPWM